MSRLVLPQADRIYTALCECLCLHASPRHVHFLVGDVLQHLLLLLPAILLVSLYLIRYTLVDSLPAF